MVEIPKSQEISIIFTSKDCIKTNNVQMLIFCLSYFITTYYYYYEGLIWKNTVFRSPLFLKWLYFLKRYSCASLCFKSVVQLMTNDSIELHTKASSSMIVKVEEVFFPSSSSMAMAMWFEENLNDVCSSLLANDDHTTLHSPV